jgi:NAD(P)-dependent dehydrogenase (short-subunit alcohol dehydrogenase family)
VVLLARDPSGLAAAADEIGPNAVGIATDVCDPDAVRAAFAAIEQRFGKLDAMINNAGSSPLRRIEHLSDAEIAQTVGTNFLGAIYCTRSAIPLLRAGGGGDIVNISSESTRDPFPFLGLYASSKAGLETFSRATQSEVKPDGTRVTTLVCGATETEWARDWDMGELTNFLDAATASGHLSTFSAPTTDRRRAGDRVRVDPASSPDARRRARTGPQQRRPVDDHKIDVILSFGRARITVLPFTAIGRCINSGCSTSSFTTCALVV